MIEAFLRQSGCAAHYTDDELDDLDALCSEFEHSPHRGSARDILKLVHGEKSQLLESNVKNFARLMTELDTRSVVRGIHAIRSYVAYRLHHKNFHVANTGVLVLKDFLYGELEPMAQAIAYEIEMSGPPSVSRTSWNALDGFAKSGLVPTLLGPLRSFIGGNPLETQTQLSENSFYQQVCNLADDNDVQKVAHHDTFYPAFKFWYFPYAVTEDDGPFTYSMGSNRWNMARMLWSHRQHLDIMEGHVAAGRTYGHSEGSLRAFGTELSEMGYPPMSRITVPANTLVIADVFGFHARGGVSRDVLRTAVHGSIRTRTPL